MHIENSPGNYVVIVKKIFLFTVYNLVLEIHSLTFMDLWNNVESLYFFYWNTLSRYLIMILKQCD